MGLDMYMYLRKWEANHENKADFYPGQLESLETMIKARNFLSKSTEYQVGYWRKANAIHKWFVDNCANGKDECQDIWVDEKDLLTLKATCEKVLADHSKANELLPTTSGFFFGSTEYDEWYFSDIEYTVELLNKVLAVITTDKSYDVLYRASW